jgi:hypothetical protein
MRAYFFTNSARRRRRGQGSGWLVASMAPTALHASPAFQLETMWQLTQHDSLGLDDVARTHPR